ncbi:MAG TPA: DUF456 domain-containing protein [Jiangellaceae bacterium]|nr:DUF456 domain-containing protein [Jiangellaceae bacterium]
MESGGLVLVGLAIIVGLVGIVVPILPGLVLIWGSVTVWAFVERSTTAWIVLAIASLLALASQFLKYLLPGRRLRDAGVPTRGILMGTALGVVGFFVIPVVGLVLGFVAGIYLVEQLRLRDHQSAWRSTVHALKAVGLSIFIELLAGLLIATGWLAAVTFG